MNMTGIAAGGFCWRSLMATLLFLLPLTSLSQVTEQQLETSLSQARNDLQQLEELATACLAEVEPSVACQFFLAAVDGDLIVSYLDNCAVARSWRDAFVTEQAGNDSRTSSRSDVLLGFLVDIELLCGDNALAVTTDSVLPAYRLIQSHQSTITSVSRSLQYQLDSARQDQLLEQQRNSLSRGIESQRTEARQQTQRQFDRLELQILRQQNNQALPR